ncbi:MAG: glycosyltransferase family 4 protein [Bradyrhizobium sp.]|uniref:glycosyltransferase family 4 protein n=1 Tax=Bradyrhizobium sp. TaxID=376 RepID=UPI003D141652
MNACIWYISKYAALPSRGIAGTRAFMLLREFVRSGHKSLMITSDSNHLTQVPDLDRPSMHMTVEGVDVCWVRTMKFKGAKSLGRILSWLDFEWRLWRLDTTQFPRPDAVIVSSLSLLTIFNGLRLRRRYGCRLIFEVRDIWPLSIVEEGGFSRYNPFVIMLGLIERLAYRRADAIVGTMPNLKQHVQEEVARHAPVHCIPFGVDPDMIENVTPAPPEWIEAHVPEGKFVVCHCGTIGITNALDTLLECARDMRDQAEIHFLLVGDGDLRAQYQARCADLSNVTFTGRVQKEMVQSVIARCDLLYFSAHPSKVWDYGMSLNKIIDYMLSAKPILGSYSGFRTMIEEAGSGSVVPAGDVASLKAELLRYFAMSTAEREVMGARGREWLLRNRSYRRLAEEYLRIALPDRAAAEHRSNESPLDHPVQATFVRS